jgi:hypothetical protein
MSIDKAANNSGIKENPFNALRRKNQPISSPQIEKSTATLAQATVGDFLFDGLEDGIPLTITLQKKIIPDTSLKLEVKELVDNSFNSKEKDLSRLEKAFNNFGKVKGGPLENTNEDQKTKPKSFGERTKPTTYKIAPVSFKNSNIDRIKTIERALTLIKIIAPFYGIEEDHRELEKARLLELSDEDLAYTTNGYEYVSDHVRVMTDISATRSLVFNQDKSLQQYFETNGVGDDYLEINASAKTIAQKKFEKDTSNKSRK